MGKNSAIEWTDHTFNPWWGCERVSPACDNCYAETWAHRLGKDLWGKDAPRRFFSDDHWREPFRWNRQAEREGNRRRVFCASMADVFERRKDLDAERERLWPVIENTPMLDWLLLTKRPANARTIAPWGNDWPSNVWLGTTAENQQWYEARAKHLDAAPARIVFMSFEPLLGPISLQDRRLDWAIVGGESGVRARAMEPQWALSLRDQCVARGIPFHFKQWGEYRMGELLGKKKSGRMLEGRTWDELPVNAAFG
ncbi:MAG TPA: phage Gp37/Gp68 family protein [Thermoanaerobaculia bacterium]|nr:phage Gp37/Gp68 family protein [Thermoanaerobaculia bacterium]